MSGLVVIQFLHICKMMLLEVRDVTSEPDIDKVLTETVRLKINAACLGRLSTFLHIVLNMIVDYFVIFITTPMEPDYKAHLITTIDDIVNILNGPAICRQGGLTRILLRCHITMGTKVMLLTYIKLILQVLIEVTSLPEGYMVNFTSYAIMQVMS